MHRLLIRVKVNMRMIFHDFLFRILDPLSIGVQIPRSQSLRLRLLSNNNFGPIELLYIPADCDHLKPQIKSYFSNLKIFTNENFIFIGASDQCTTEHLNISIFSFFVSINGTGYWFIWA